MPRSQIANIPSQAGYVFAGGLAQAVAVTVRRGSVGQFRGLIALAKAIQIGDPRGVAAVNRRLAAMMHQSVKASYRSTVEANRRVPSYARQNRYGGGALRRVIDAEDFVTADAHGVYYVNVNRLNKEARHWKRLNFGALPQAGAPPARFRLSFSGVAAGTPFGFRPQAQAPFGIPVGFFRQGNRNVSPSREFRGAGSIGAFYPRSRRMLATTQGIRARNFLDAGLARLQREFEPQYDLYLANQIQRGTRAGLAARSELVKVPASPFLNRFS